MKQIIAATFLLLTACLPSWAGDVYSWEDKTGYHMTDDLGKVPAKYRSKYSIENKNETAGYTNKGIKTDKAWKVELQLAEVQYKGESAGCINKFIDGTPEMTACIRLASENFKSSITSIPNELIAKRQKILSQFHGKDYFNQLGKDW